METLLIQQTEKSNKFWKIVVKEKDYVVFYGKKTTSCADFSVKHNVVFFFHNDFPKLIWFLSLLDYETEEECMKEANKLVASKRKKGYTDPFPGEDYIKHNVVFFFHNDFPKLIWFLSLLD
jgi:predicted DNA-binding WGR domain protein